MRWDCPPLDINPVFPGLGEIIIIIIITIIIIIIITIINYYYYYYYYYYYFMRLCFFISGLYLSLRQKKCFNTTNN